MGVWSDASDNWDELIETLIPTDGFQGYAGVYHKEGLDGWRGPSGFYNNDHRVPPDTDKSKLWDSLYLWADPSNHDDVMSLSIEGEPSAPPGDDRQYFLRLMQVPPDLDGAPPLGTIWEIPTDRLFTLDVPSFRTENGLEGYRFSFTMTEVIPEPTTALLMLPAMMWLLTRRRSPAA